MSSRFTSEIPLWTSGLGQDPLQVLLNLGIDPRKDHPLITKKTIYTPATNEPILSTITNYYQQPLQREFLISTVRDIYQPSKAPLPPFDPKKLSDIYQYGFPTEKELRQYIKDMESYPYSSGLSAYLHGLVKSFSRK